MTRWMHGAASKAGGFCAICTSERGPFEMRPLGRGGHPVSVCADCDTEPALERHGPERPYEVPERHAIGNQLHAFATAANRITGDTAATHKARRAGKTIMRNAEPGFIMLRVKRQLGVDAREARATFSNEPWFRDIRHLGSTKRYHLFERPDAEAASRARQPEADPLAELAAMSARSK